MLIFFFICLSNRINKNVFIVKEKKVKAVAKVKIEPEKDLCNPYYRPRAALFTLPKVPGTEQDSSNNSTGKHANDIDGS